MEYDRTKVLLARDDSRRLATKRTALIPQSFDRRIPTRARLATLTRFRGPSTGLTRMTVDTEVIPTHPWKSP